MISGVGTKWEKEEPWPLGFGLSNWILVPFTETVKKPKEEDDLGLGYVEAGISGTLK